MTNLLKEATQKDIIALIEETGSNTVEVLQTVDHYFLELPSFVQSIMLERIFTGISTSEIKVNSVSFFDFSNAGYPVVKINLTITNEQINTIKKIEQQHSDLISNAIVVSESLSLNELTTCISNGHNEFAIIVPRNYVELSEEDKMNYLSNRIVMGKTLVSKHFILDSRSTVSPKTQLYYQILKINEVEISKEKVHTKESLFTKLKKMFYIFY